MKRKVSYKRVFFWISLLFLVALFGLNFVSQKKSSEPTDFPAKVNLCKQDSDCLLAVKTDQCCACPGVYSRAQVKVDESLIVYRSGENYFPKRKADCLQIQCQPCPVPGEPECAAGICQAQAVFQGDPRTKDWQEYLNEKIGFEINYPEGVYLFEEGDQVVFRCFGRSQSGSVGSLYSYYLQIYSPVETSGQTPFSMAQNALKVEMALVESYGGDPEKCLQYEVQRELRSGQRLNFCSGFVDKSETVPQFSEWYLVDDKILEISGRVMESSKQEEFELMLSTLRLL